MHHSRGHFDAPDDRIAEGYRGLSDAVHFERLKTALFRTRERTRFDQAAADRILPASLRSGGQCPAGVIGIRPEHGAIPAMAAHRRLAGGQTRTPNDR